jgi:hypothetical protein
VRFLRLRFALLVMAMLRRSHEIDWTPERQAHVCAVVREHPMQSDESPLAYVVRIAVESGLVEAQAGLRRFPGREVDA